MCMSFSILCALHTQWAEHLWRSGTTHVIFTRAHWPTCCPGALKPSGNPASQSFLIECPIKPTLSSGFTCVFLYTLHQTMPSSINFPGSKFLILPFNFFLYLVQGIEQWTILLRPAIPKHLFSVHLFLSCPPSSRPSFPSLRQSRQLTAVDWTSLSSLYPYNPCCPSQAD